MLKKNVLLPLLLFAFFYSSGQEKMNPTNAKLKKGVIASYLNTGFRYKESNWRETNDRDSLTSIQSKNGSDVAVGLFLQPAINKNIYLRFSALIMFENASFSFAKQNEVKKIKISKLNVGLPVQALFTVPSLSKKIYVVAGTTFMIGLGDDKTIKDIMPTKQLDISGDVGLGMLIERKSYMLCPEIVFSKGFINLKGNAKNLYHRVIESYTGNTFSFSLILRSK